MNSMYLTPVVGATIGYFTNWLAIKMIFRPYEEKRFFGVKVPFTPGLIAVERKRITQQVGYVVTNHLLTNDDLESKILNFDFDHYYKSIISTIENSVSNSELTFDDLLKDILKDDYSATKSQIIQLISDRIKNNDLSSKSLEELQLIEKDIKAVLPEVLLVVKTVFENDMYNIDTILTDFFDELIKSAFQGLGALISGFINSEKLYLILKSKIIENISENPDKIEDKIIKILYDNKDSEKTDFEINKIIEVSVNNLLSSQLSSILPLVKMLNNENLSNKFSIIFKKFFADEINNILLKIDINSLIIEKIDEMPLNEIEALIMSIAKKEISAITNIGGVLGFIIGLITILFY